MSTKVDFENRTIDITIDKDLTPEDIALQLSGLYDERIRYEEEYARRSRMILGDDRIAQVREVQEELEPTIKEIKKKIRAYEKAIKSMILDYGADIETDDVCVGFIPGSRTEITFPGTDLLPIVKEQAARAVIIRNSDKGKRYPPAQMMMKLFAEDKSNSN